jgi:hypothetical protein
MFNITQFYVLFTQCIDVCFVWILVGKREGKKPLGRPKRAREDDIKIELTRNKTGWAWTGFIWLGIGASLRLL